MMDDKTERLPAEFDTLVLTEYPYPFAVLYRRFLNTVEPEKQVRMGLLLFDMLLRSLAFALVGQYVARDAASINDQMLNNLIQERLPRSTLGSWKHMLFAALKAYRGKRDLFFIPELYDLYWDISRTPNRRRPDVERPFDKLIELRNQISVGWEEPNVEHSETVAVNLREVLVQMTWLADYQLILPLEKGEGVEQAYMLFKGEEATVRAIGTHTGKELEPGRFFLRRRDGAVLSLYPFIIHWEEPAPERSALPFGEPAIFNTFTSKCITYLAPLGGQKIEIRDASAISYLVSVMQPPEPPPAPRLSWVVMKEVAAKISERNFGHVGARFNRDLYLQPSAVKQVFYDFLASDKGIFLLLGKSGVGKSSFVISLAEELQGRDDSCVLVYDGATISTERPLGETINRDIAAFVKLRARDAEAAVPPFPASIAEIEEIGSKKVVVVIDALNENADARSLLRRIDELVSSSPYRWLKVLITSRPASWQALNRGVALAAHLYYHPPGFPQEMGVELEPFEVPRWVELQNFTRADLAEVYERYRLAYSLLTPYEELLSDTRRLLTDPLVLKLVAAIYSGKAIPTQVRPQEIYQAYLNELVRGERLHFGDLRFLEEELMPLMVSEGHYSNTITTDQMESGRPPRGEPLVDLVFNSDLLPNGRAANQSFQNLVDAEVLVLVGAASDHEITFKYERFYDYFAGRRLIKMAEAHTDRAAFYRNLILMTGKQTAWGVE